MRPIRLEMKGFSAFREETVIDFRDVELLALVGPTGSGKSSVIDAMTFALYGSAARYDEKVVAPVINQLSTEARVRFDFEVGGVTYSATRVVRRLKNGGASTKEARFERGDSVLAGDQKQLNEQVIELLGLNFERFNKTVVLPQGRFAEFLHDKPTARQELLRELLGLGVYERLARHARERASQLQNKADVVQGTLFDVGDMSDEHFAELQTAAKTVASVRSNFATETATHAAKESRLSQLSGELTVADHQLQLLESIEVPQNIDELSDEVAAAIAAEHEAGLRRDDARAQLRVASEAVSNGPSISDCRRLLDAYDRHRELTARLGEAVDRLATARSSLALATGRASNARESIVAAKAHRDDIRAQREAAEQAAQAAGDRSAVQDVIAKIEEREKAAGELIRLSGEADETARRTQAASDAATKQRNLVAALEALAPAAALAAHLTLDEPCPVCAQVVHTFPTVHHADDRELAAARSELASAELAADQAQREDLRLSAHVRVVEQRHDALADQLLSEPDHATVVAQLQLLLELEATVAAARASAGEVERAVSRAESDPSTLAAFEVERGATGEVTAAEALETQHRTDLQQSSTELSDHPAEHEIRTELETAEQLSRARDAAQRAEQSFEDEHSTHKAALDGVLVREHEARQDFDAARDLVAALKPPKATKSLSADWAALDAWRQAQAAAVIEYRAQLVAAHLEAVEQHRRWEETLRASVVDFVNNVAAPLEELRDQLVEAEASARTAVEQVKNERKRVARARHEIESLRADAEVATLLGKLLRNDGFQRWLLEEAMTDLVERATVRLRDLTAGQYSLVSDDGLFRIVDHRNADEVRDARSLSGGETFLTSLALALALADSSMDLASEGTAPLESIFLDEGFGTLDPETLEVVAGTIEELGATGRMVGIVTHIRDLAERMPTRMEVTKGANGSSVQRVDV